MSAKIDLEYWISKCTTIHKGKYDYSKSIYKSAHEYIKVICPIHGEFQIRAYNHYRYGCPECRLDKLKAGTTTLGFNEFEKRAKRVHNNKYFYVKESYVNMTTKVKIICPIHGAFYQKASNHVSLKQGCPKCKESRGEQFVEELLKHYDIKYQRQKSFISCKYKLPLRFDFYLPEYNLIIEYDGEQHYKKAELFSRKQQIDPVRNLEAIKTRDSVKNKYCDENDIVICRVKYNEDINSKIKSFLFL